MVWRNRESYIGNILLQNFEDCSIVLSFLVLPLIPDPLVYVSYLPLKNFHSLLSAVDFRSDLPWYLSVLIHCAGRGSENFLYKGPRSKYFVFCGPHYDPRHIFFLFFPTSLKV